MIGALNGRITATIPRHYPEFDIFEAFPAGEHAAFEDALAKLLAKRSQPLSEAERQLAHAVGRAMWRGSMYHGLGIRSREVRAAIEEGRR